MGFHPWESSGLAVFLLLTIPVDIWAIGLSARTVFLERLGLEPPPSLGFSLWWQGMALTLLYGAAAYVIESRTVGVAKSLAARIIEIEAIKSLPVAERIAIELTLWGSVAVTVLTLLILGWLVLFGKVVERQVQMARTTPVPYEERVVQGDLMRVPADQPLVLAILTGTGLVGVVLLWGFMPVTTPHPHESYKKEARKVVPLKPQEVLEKTERVLAQAESAIQMLEEKARPGVNREEQGKRAANDAVTRGAQVARLSEKAPRTTEEPLSRSTPVRNGTAIDVSEVTRR
jgi:hypothetical protein